MIEILKEADVTGRIKFVPSPENLKELSDAALEVSTENGEEIAKLKKALELAMLAIAELTEATEETRKEKDNE